MGRQTQVGFIGLGDQGAPMAAAIANDYSLHVWARRENAYSALGDSVFTVHPNATALARSVDVLCVCLRNDADLRELLAGGVLKALPTGAVLVNHATGDPDEARTFADICATIGIGFVDAPVSGGRPGAIARSLTCFAGSKAETLERCRGIISTHSKHIVHMGDAGTGQAAKLCNNALTISNLRNLVEVFGIADVFGVTPSSLQTAFAHSSGGSFILDALGTKITPQIAAHIARLNRADVKEFADAAKKRGQDVTALESWALGGADGLEDLISRICA